MQKKKMEFETYAHSFQVFPRLGLERISALMECLGHPEKDCRCIHVAGTNGKGSVCFALSSVLSEAGEKVGLYTSPNLVRVNERIRVNGAPISDEDLAGIIGEVQVACEAVLAKTGETPTPFEIWTASAFLYFARQRCTLVVLETGLGGRYDATNVITENELSILTRIDFDHTQHLGNTLSEIASNKCGILKARQAHKTVLSAPQDREAAEEICRQANAIGLTPLFVHPPKAHGFSDLYEMVDYPELGEIKLPFAGMHQIENMTLVIEAAKLLGISPKQIKEGLAKAKHPGRMQVLSAEPLLLYDGGHNPGGITALVQSLIRYKKDVTFTVIFAAMADKDIMPSLSLLAPITKKMLCTTVQNNPRAMTADALTALAQKAGITAESVPTLDKAIQKAKTTPTLICGSLYLYSDLPLSLQIV